MSDNICNGVHNYSPAEGYVVPKDPRVREKLEEFQDRKLGIMMHWSPVSQWGLIESWAQSDDDSEWSQVDVEWTKDMDEMRRQYRDLQKTFNPIRYNPQQWAKLAKDNGFKYLLFTTKHHDGFCMWDTKQTDYKITSQNCPFHTHKYKDIIKHLYNAFRHEGIGIHTYFSKPDWDCDYYWSKNHSFHNGKTTRNPNYDLDKYPEEWEKFVKFTHAQLRELLTGYGPIDCLWLDGGQVNPNNLGQDIRLGEIVEEIRETTQPGLLCADRTVGGDYENFLTPEQKIPEQPILVPWESCITMGDTFSFKYCSGYKSTRQIVHMFLEIVSKGGNMALNVTPQPDGRLPVPVIDRMNELGKFMKDYGDGIYGTRPVAPYFDKNMAFMKKGSKVYVYTLIPEENQSNTVEMLIPYSLGNVKEVSSVHGEVLSIIDGEGCFTLRLCRPCDKQQYVCCAVLDMKQE